MFVTFEGIDGSGKTSLMKALAARFSAQGQEVILTREPGGSSLGARIREMVLDAKTEGLDARAELFLFLADRAQHVATLIKPALDRGSLVFSDRFADSTFAYQGNGRGLELETLETLNTVAAGGLAPDVTFLLDLPVSVAMARIAARKGEGEARFDGLSVSFHEEVRRGFLTLASRFSHRIRVLNAEKSLEDLSDEAETLLVSVIRGTYAGRP
ncbi:MAG: dTMP kinase [Desulfovibrio sp.]|nr:dTMP kinase [Desulfovibrio sp.]